MKSNITDGAYGDMSRVRLDSERVRRTLNDTSVSIDDRYGVLVGYLKFTIAPTLEVWHHDFAMVSKLVYEVTSFFGTDFFHHEGTDIFEKYPLLNKAYYHASQLELGAEFHDDDEYYRTEVMKLQRAFEEL